MHRLIRQLINALNTIKSKLLLVKTHSLFWAVVIGIAILFYALSYVLLQVIQLSDDARERMVQSLLTSAIGLIAAFIGLVVGRHIAQSGRAEVELLGPVGSAQDVSLAIDSLNLLKQSHVFHDVEHHFRYVGLGKLLTGEDLTGKYPALRRMVWPREFSPDFTVGLQGMKVPVEVLILNRGSRTAVAFIDLAAAQQERVSAKKRDYAIVGSGLEQGNPLIVAPGSVTPHACLVEFAVKAPRRDDWDEFDLAQAKWLAAHRALKDLQSGMQLKVAFSIVTVGAATGLDRGATREERLSHVSILAKPSRELPDFAGYDFCEALAQEVRDLDSEREKLRESLSEEVEKQTKRRETEVKEGYERAFTAIQREAIRCLCLECDKEQVHHQFWAAGKAPYIGFHEDSATFNPFAVLLPADTENLILLSTISVEAAADRGLKVNPLDSELCNKVPHLGFESQTDPSRDIDNLLLPVILAAHSILLASRQQAKPTP